MSSLQRACLDEVLIAPSVLTALEFPSLIDSEHREMVTVLVVELCLLLVCELLLLARSIEDVLDREHRDDCDDFIRTAQVDRGQHHLCKLGLQRELSHQSTELGQ